jgi:hypothetical protein
MARSRQANSLGVSRLTTFSFALFLGIRKRKHEKPRRYAVLPEKYVMLA